MLTDKEYKDKGFINLKGKWYATLKTLLNEAHERYGNRFSIKTKLIEYSIEEKRAIFMAQIDIGTNEEKQVFTAYGDADKSNTGVMIQPSFLRMAETRAIVRALRFATNIAETSMEEMD